MPVLLARFTQPQSLRHSHLCDLPSDLCCTGLQRSSHYGRSRGQQVVRRSLLRRSFHAYQPDRHDWYHSCVVRSETESFCFEHFGPGHTSRRVLLCCIILDCTGEVSFFYFRGILAEPIDDLVSARRLGCCGQCYLCYCTICVVMSS